MSVSMQSSSCTTSARPRSVVQAWALAGTASGMLSRWVPSSQQSQIFKREGPQSHARAAGGMLLMCTCMPRASSEGMRSKLQQALKQGTLALGDDASSCLSTKRLLCWHGSTSCARSIQSAGIHTRICPEHCMSRKTGALFSQDVPAMVGQIHTSARHLAQMPGRWANAARCSFSADQSWVVTCMP